MAPVEPQLIDTDWDAAFAQVRAFTSRPSLVVVLTAQDAPAAARGFLGPPPALSRRTRVLVGTVTDDPSPDAARPDAADVYHAAAAARTERDAAAVAVAIGRAGAEAIAASPETVISDRGPLPGAQGGRAPLIRTMTPCCANPRTRAPVA